MQSKQKSPVKRKNLLAVILFATPVIVGPACFSVRGSSTVAKDPTAAVSVNLEPQFGLLGFPVHTLAKILLVWRVVLPPAVLSRLDASQEQVSLILQGCVFLLLSLIWTKKSRRPVADPSRT